MILEHMYDHMGDEVNHMMGWGTYAWFYMIFGFLFFIIIVLILIYLLNRGPSLVENSKILEPHLNHNLKNKGTYGDFENKKASYCPNCGAKLTERAVTFCPHCGTKI